VTIGDPSFLSSDCVSAIHSEIISSAFWSAARRRIPWLGQAPLPVAFIRRYREKVNRNNGSVKY
jgi:hypothetical protein